MWEKEDFLEITSGSVFLVDYVSLRNDFPQLNHAEVLKNNPKLKALAKAEQERVIRQAIDVWLLKNASLISTQQALGNMVNEKVPVSNFQKKAYRPPRYGRGCVAETSKVEACVPDFPYPISIDGGGAFDLKGVGVRKDATPMVDFHSNGILFLDGAYREYLFQKLIALAFEHSKSEFTTLPYYAVIDTGFEAEYELKGGSRSRFSTGIIVRRSHRRHPKSDLPKLGSAWQYRLFEVEMLLRRYGITSSRDNTIEIDLKGGETELRFFGKLVNIAQGNLIATIKSLGIPLPFFADRINIQSDYNDESNSVLQIVDFDQYTIRKDFSKPVLSVVRDVLLGWGGYLDPKDPQYVQPDTKLIPQQEFWKSDTLLNKKIATLISNFRNGTLGHLGVNKKTTAILLNATSRWL